MSTLAATSAFGAQLRRWRLHRRLSQEALAGDAEISSRHLSCLESGKARPSREMVLVLASALEIPLRERNVLLAAAGFAPVYRESVLEAGLMAPVKRALEALLEKQEPYGALVVDRAWNILRMNRGAARLFARFPPSTPDASVAGNLMRSLFHPQGVRPHVVNWEEVAGVMAERLHRESASSVEDDACGRLRDEVLRYQGVPAQLELARVGQSADPFVAVHLRNGAEEVRLFTLLTTLGTPLDVTAQELAIESYFPADETSDRYLHALAPA